MNLFRKLLYPFSLLYAIITGFRNLLYDKGILKSYSFDCPIIAVGNLNVGGTGKTPQVEYLIRLLSQNHKVATLSRGYKRKSKGYILANSSSSAAVLGDEPYQLHQKFPNIQVAVDTDRKNGIEHLLSQANKPDVILLDDAFQHRKVQAGFYILLTSYNDLFVNDCILPTGNLRESSNGAKRANLIIVTKCPKNLSDNQREKVRLALKIAENQELFFSFIEYDEFVYSENKIVPITEITSISKLVLAGIAKPKPFFAYLQNQTDIVMEFSDHHHFTEKEIVDIKNKANNRIIITTEKDYVRLNCSILKEQLFYLPIKTSFKFDSKNFDKKIIDYVGTSSRNS